MMRTQARRWLNLPPLLVILLTTILIGSTACAAEAQVESRKSPWGAFGLSFLITGAGQAYNGQWGKGGLMLGGQVVSAGVMVAGADDCDFFDSGDDCNFVLAGAIGFVGFWVWSWIDAPITANAINRRIDAGQVTIEIGPQLIVPQGRSAIGGLRRSGFPSFHRDSRVGLSLVRVRF